MPKPKRGNQFLTTDDIARDLAESMGEFPVRLVSAGWASPTTIRVGDTITISNAVLFVDRERFIIRKKEESNGSFTRR